MNRDDFSSDITGLIAAADAAFDALPGGEKAVLRKAAEQAERDREQPAPEALAHLENYLDRSGDAVVQAHMVAEQIVAAARNRAAVIVEEAQREAHDLGLIARKTLRDAHERAEEIKAEAERLLRAAEQEKRDAEEATKKANREIAVQRERLRAASTDDRMSTAFRLACAAVADVKEGEDLRSTVIARSLAKFLDAYLQATSAELEFGGSEMQAVADSETKPFLRVELAQRMGRRSHIVIVDGVLGDPADEPAEETAHAG